MLVHHRMTIPAAMAERDVCSRQSARCAVKNWKAWLVPPVVFPIFLILMIAAYAVFRPAG